MIKKNYYNVIIILRAFTVSADKYEYYALNILYKHANNFSQADRLFLFVQLVVGSKTKYEILFLYSSFFLSILTNKTARDECNDCVKKKKTFRRYTYRLNEKTHTRPEFVRSHT